MRFVATPQKVTLAQDFLRESDETASQIVMTTNCKRLEAGSDPQTLLHLLGMMAGIAVGFTGQLRFPHSDNPNRPPLAGCQINDSASQSVPVIEIRC